MSEEVTRQETHQGPLGREPRQQGDSPLVTDRGTTSISKNSVSQVVNTVTEGADGLRIGGRGVSVEVGQEEVAIDINASADYNRSILQVTEALRNEVTDRVESLLGLRVTECNITIDDIYFPHEESQQQEAESEEPRVR